MFDPSRLQTVSKKVNRKEQNFDLRFNSEKQTFVISEKFFNENRLSLNGFKVGIYENGQVVLSVQSDDNSDFLRLKKGASGKTKAFKHPVLTEMLTSRGIESGEINLISLGEFEGVKYYAFNPEEKEKTKSLSSIQNNLDEGDFEDPDHDFSIEEDQFEDESL